MNLDALKRLADVHHDEIVQFFQYFGVSATAFCVDCSVYWSLLSIAHFAFVAAIGGYVCGVLTHYMMSSRIVFRNRFHKRGLVQEAPTLAKFFAAGLSGMLVTATVVGLLADVIGIHPLLAKFCAAGCSFMVVFLCMRFLVFNQLPKPGSVKPAMAAA